MAVLECAEEPFWILARFFRLHIVALLQPVTQSEQVQGVELQGDRFIFLVIHLFSSFHDCLFLRFEEFRKLFQTMPCLTTTTITGLTMIGSY